ncbi:MAG: GntP family permease [Verrucomicrobiota bacterium]|jgi:GntP family gluconate:H+ symporter|nr:GntP family permease [Verrucomicrobiota bacterium]
MDPLIVLLIGMAVVVGGVLWLRLHAFVALIGGALVVGALATPEGIEQSVMNDSRIEKEMRKQATNRLDKDHPNLSNLVQDLHKTQAKHTASQSVIVRVTTAFGKACGSLGILIAMAAIIGKCLLESGGAERIIRSALGLLGEKRAPLAFTGSGFLLGTPVFFDTVFYLMIPLGKALAMRFRENYGLYIMTIVAGATMAHSLVPPTPGPLFVADQLDVDLGLMIVMGLVIGSVACATGYVYAKFVNGHDRWRVPLRDSADSPLAKLEEIVRRDDKSLPPLGLSLLPVLLPIALITGNTILQKLVAEPPVGLAAFLSVVGDKNIALILSAAVALGLLALQKRGDKQALANSVQAALASGGVVILITAAGASFGTVLQQTNIAERISDLAAVFNITGLLVLPLAFFVTAIVRTAQGSATVSMITSVGIFAGMAGELPFHPVYLAMAIGCGSKPFPWMNDSGFWVINRMSGMTIRESIRSVSFLMTVMAIDGLVAVMLLAWLFPMSG